METTTTNTNRYENLPLGTLMALSRHAQEMADAARKDRDFTTYGGEYYRACTADMERFEADRDELDSAIEARFARTDALVYASHKEDLS